MVQNLRSASSPSKLKFSITKRDANSPTLYNHKYFQFESFHICNQSSYTSGDASRLID